MANILNTRPAHQAIMLTHALQKKNHRVIELPLMTIDFISCDFASVIHADCIIFLSSNAVMAFFEKQAELIPTLQKKIIIAIGTGTQKTLQEKGFHHVLIPTQFDSAGILQLPILQSIHHKKIAIICGENAKSVLSTVLAERGAIINVITCYKRVPIQYDANRVIQNNKDIDTIICTSHDNLLLLIQLFSSHREWLLSKTICVISTEMKKTAEKTGCHRVLLADNATDNAVVSACC